MKHKPATESTHPAYGIIQAQRVHSSHRDQLFGSDVRTSNSIAVRVSRATLCEGDAGNEWAMASENLIEVRMTEAQFASFICSANCGPGTPCTIVRADGVLVEAPPERRRRERLRQLLAASAADVGGELAAATAKLQEVQKAGKIGKRDLAEIESLLATAKRIIEGRMPYYLDQFEQVLDAAATEVMADVRGRIEATIAEAGMDHLQQLKQIAGGIE